MKEPIVVDSTSLIGLERIARLELLPALYEPVIAPPAVREEFGSDLLWLRIVGYPSFWAAAARDNQEDGMSVGRPSEWRRCVGEPFLRAQGDKARGKQAPGGLGLR